MELFKEIRREHEFGVGTIQGVSRKLGDALSCDCILHSSIRLTHSSSSGIA